MADEAGAGAGEGTALARVVARVTDAPAYPPSPGDLRTVSVLGLALPLRASIAVISVSLLLLLDSWILGLVVIAAAAATPP